MTVSDLDRSVEFYAKVLSFEKLSEVEVSGSEYDHLQGVFGLRIRVARLRLGDEFIELTEYLAPRGRQVPADSRSNDHWFQHIAIIVSDMKRAYQWLRHRSFELPQWLAYFFAFCGALSCENGPIKWVAQHRMHHAHSDSDRDPHSAKKGFWWSHMGWMLYEHSEFDDPEKIRAFSKDFCDDKFYQFLDNHFIKIQVAFGCLLFLIGGIPWVIWGIFLRLVLVYHETWLVNSAAHMFGYKNVRLQNDLSTNCWWVGLLAWGEGWHNNHHAFPSSARHGLRRWEFDATWVSISILKFLGLATNLKVAQLQPGGGDGYYTGEVTREAA